MTEFTVRDVASVMGWEEVPASSIDLSWYTTDMYREPAEHSTLEGDIETVFISRDPACLDLDTGTTPHDYVLYAFISGGVSYLVTYTDGFGFEYTNRVNWGRVLTLAQCITTKSDWAGILDSVNLFIDNAGNPL